MSKEEVIGDSAGVGEASNVGHFGPQSLFLLQGRMFLGYSNILMLING